MPDIKARMSEKFAPFHVSLHVLGFLAHFISRYLLTDISYLSFGSSKAECGYNYDGYITMALSGNVPSSIPFSSITARRRFIQSFYSLEGSQPHRAKRNKHYTTASESTPVKFAGRHLTPLIQLWYPHARTAPHGLRLTTTLRRHKSPNIEF